jgi:hypothetical protein
MRWFMIGLALLGLVLVPWFWITSHEIMAIVVMLVVLTMLVQAACIDLPGSSYTKIHNLWKHRNKGGGKPPASG